MPKVMLRQKLDGEDVTILVEERAVPIHEKAGWKVAPKTMQPTDSPAKSD